MRLYQLFTLKWSRREIGSSWWPRGEWWWQQRVLDESLLWLVFLMIGDCESFQRSNGIVREKQGNGLEAKRIFHFRDTQSWGREGRRATVHLLVAFVTSPGVLTARCGVGWSESLGWTCHLRWPGLFYRTQLCIDKLQSRGWNNLQSSQIVVGVEVTKGELNCEMWCRSTSLLFSLYSFVTVWNTAAVHLSSAELKDHFPPPAGSALSNAEQVISTLLWGKGMLLAHVQLGDRLFLAKNPPKSFRSLIFRRPSYRTWLAAVKWNLNESLL